MSLQGLPAPHCLGPIPGGILSLLSQFGVSISRQVSYPSWLSKLTKLVLRARSPFSAFLAFSIQVSMQSAPRPARTPPLFPVPIPSLGVFSRMPDGLSSARRRSRHLSRALHVCCMALNFWYGGGVSCEKELLRREPNYPAHRRLYSRLRSFIKADGLLLKFDMLRAGRRHPELVARLSELTSLLVKLGCSTSPYDKAYVGYEVSADNSVLPELEPYRDLDPSRLKISGAGQWDVTSYLSDQLVMAYREPASIWIDRVPEVWEYPQIRDPPETVCHLAKLWDIHGLLFLHHEKVSERPSFELVKVFNCYKSAEIDRQIGDRRGRNSVECKVDGPSSDLPAGPDICDLAIDLKTQRLALSVSDRRDFYHQIWVTQARAVSNTLGPGLPTDWLKDTEAYGHLLLRDAVKKYDRRTHGDRLGVEKPAIARKHPVLWVAFKSVLQGDHAGVEIATDAHANLLRSFGLLDADTRMRASSPCFSNRLVEGLVIDDYFAISVDPKGTTDDQTLSAKAYDKACDAYGHARLQGSPEKDVKGAQEGKAIGAYVNSSDRAIAAGVCTIGAPPERG